MTRIALDDSVAFRYACQPMKYAIVLTRVLLGLVFVFFGSNAFFQFLPMPPMEGPGGAFIGAMMSTGYIYAIAGLQVVGGLLLILGARFVALGLTLLGPIIVNIVLFHIFFDLKGMPVALVIAALSLFLLWVYRYKFPALYEF